MAFCALVETVWVSVEVISPVTVTALSPSTRLTAAGEATSLTSATSPTVIPLPTGKPRTSSSESTESSGTPTTTGVSPSVVTVLPPRSEPSEVETSAGESPALAAFSGSTSTSTSGLPPERSLSTLFTSSSVRNFSVTMSAALGELLLGTARKDGLEAALRRAVREDLDLEVLPVEVVALRVYPVQRPSDVRALL